MTEPTRRTWRRRTAALACLAVLAAPLATGARFVDSDVVDGIVFTSGVLDLAVTPAEHLFDVGAMAPGDQVTGRVMVVNSGTVDLDYTVTVSRAADSGDLAEVLATDLVDATGRSLVSSAGLGSAVPEEVGTVVTTLPAGGSQLLTTTVTLPREAGPAYAGAAAALAWTFDAAQAAPDPTPVPLPPLRGAWELDETAGLTATDSSGAGLHAVVTGGARWTPGLDGGALHLDGATGQARVPDSPGLDVDGAMTISAWVRPERHATQYVVKKAETYETDGYELAIAVTGRPFFRLNEATYGSTFRVDGPDVVPVDGQAWVHVAGTYDGQVMRLYVDGVEVGAVPGPSHVAANDLPLVIGNQPSSDYPLLGAVDQVRLYGGAMTPEQVAALHAATRHP